MIKYPLLLLTFTSCSLMPNGQPHFYDAVEVKSGFYRGCYGILLGVKHTPDGKEYQAALSCPRNKGEELSTGTIVREEFTIIGG